MAREIVQPDSLVERDVKQNVSAAQRQSEIEKSQIVEHDQKRNAQPKNNAREGNAVAPEKEQHSHQEKLYQPGPMLNVAEKPNFIGWKNGSTRNGLRATQNPEHGEPNAWQHLSHLAAT